MLQRLPVDQAAVSLGLSVATVKRRLKKGTLRGEQEATPSGFKWVVLVDDAATPAATADGVAGVAAATAPATAGATAGAALLSQRAEDMARYSAALLEPYVQRIEELSRENGALYALLAAAQTQSAPPVNDQAGRSWWRRLWGTG